MATPLAQYRAHVLFQAVADGGVLLDTTTELYFGLNAVGARVCELLPQHESLEALCAEIAREYPDVPESTVHADVRELLDELVANGLLEWPVQDSHAGNNGDSGPQSS